MPLPDIPTKVNYVPNIGAYEASNPTPAPSYQPSSPATQTPVASSAPSKSSFIDLVQETPQYQQAIQNVDLWGQQQQNQQAFDADWANQFYQQNLAQIGSGDALAAQQDALNREQGFRSLTSQKQQIELAKQRAQRDFEQQRKYVKEALTGRGNAGGQVGFETGNLQFGYDQFLAGQGLNADNAQFAYETLLKEIDLQGRGRELENTQARSNLELNRKYTVAQAEQAKQELALQIAQKRGEALLAVESQLAQLWFDQSTGNYNGPGGQTMTVEQAQASLPQSTSTTAPQQSAAVVPAWQKALAARSQGLNDYYGLGG